MAIFISDFQEVLFYLVPLVSCVLLWKLFVTKRITPPGNVIVLGLERRFNPE
ncbi:MAG TPA: hypothetical protein VFT02_11755 [Pyrinomonadaceae bacterium]|nr:hypothetical protein [Pyrinomonadaceae bacterium]